jgi:uncharacterized protein (TIGR03086 family)
MTTTRNASPSTLLTSWNVLAEAHGLLRAAVAGVPAEGWDRPTPCARWTVAQVLQHAAGDQLAYAAKLTVGPGPAHDPFTPSGDLEGSPSNLLESALTTSAAAFSTVDPDDVAVPVPLPPFTLPAALAVQAAALDAAIHAWDIALATGQPSPLTTALARALRPVADALADPLRGFAYDAAIAPAADADDVVTLLNHLGRDAAWSA